MPTAQPAPLAPPVRRPRPYRLRWWAVRTFWVSFALGIVALLWALWYVNDRGFTRKWRRMVIVEVEKHGVHIDIERLNLNPLKGLIARNVRILNQHDRSQTLAYVDEIVLDLNYSHLFYGKPFINSVDLRDAELALPISPENSKSAKFRVEHLNARIFLPPGGVHIQQADAVVYGVRVTAADCHILNPNSLRPPERELTETKSTRKRQLTAIHQWLETLAQKEWKGERPILDLHLHGDLAQWEKFYAEATFRTSGFTVGKDRPTEIRKLEITATYRDGKLHLRQCSVEDPIGRFDLVGTLSPREREVAIHLRSSLDLPALARVLEIPLPDYGVRWHSRPWIEADGVSSFPKDGPQRHRWTGRIKLGNFSAKNIAFDGAEMEFAWDGHRAFIRGGRLQHPSGALDFQALYDQQWRFSLDSRINPKTLRPFLPATGQRFLDEWDFASVPLLRFEGSLATPITPMALKGKGHFAFGKTVFRGYGFRSLTSDFSINRGAYHFPAFRLKRDEGEASGEILVEPAKDLVTLKNTRSSVTPVEAATWIDRRGILGRAVAPYRFERKPPKLKIEGVVGLKHRDELTRLLIDVVAPEVDYTFLKRDLHLKEITARLVFKNERLYIENFRGKILGGTLTGGLDVSLKPGKKDYAASIAVADVNFPTLTRLYVDYDDSKGKLAGQFQFSGVDDDARRIDGKGKLTVTDGNVFAIPLLGPFSGILNDILPGSGYNVARKAEATFTMKNGIIGTEDMEVKGSGFSMYGKGKLMVLDDKIDFSIRINAQGAAGVVLTPVSHLFEYVSDGSLSKPVWRPRHLPKAFFKSP